MCEDIVRSFCAIKDVNVEGERKRTWLVRFFERNNNEVIEFAKQH